MFFRSVLIAALTIPLLAGCNSEVSEDKTAAAQDTNCATMAPNLMKLGDAYCAQAHATQEIADAMNTIVDTQTALDAAAMIRKSQTRLTAVEERTAVLHKDSDGGDAVMASLGGRKLTAAKKAYVNAYLRIAKNYPELALYIGPALEGH